MSNEAAFPKTGHVTEVCKEWLVREDGALAYKLQSQEITDFYKGNRFRNAVVREDFPTALQEQIKEKENAEKQAESYRRYLSEQEQHDKIMAKEIAEKLEKDLLEQQQREFENSEQMAQQMQEIYVNLPLPPPTIREKRPPPPRPEKASFLLSSLSHDSGGCSRSKKQSSQKHHHAHSQNNHTSAIAKQQQQQQQQQHMNSSGHERIPSPSRQKPLNSVQHMVVSGETKFNQFVERPKNGRTPPALTNDNLSPPTPSVSSPPAIVATSTSTHQRNPHHSSSSTKRHDHHHQHQYNNKNNNNHHHHHHHHHNHHHQNQQQHQSTRNNPHSNTQTESIEEIAEYTDVTDSIRQYDITQKSSDTSALSASSSHKHHQHHQSIEKLHSSPSHENLLKADLKFQKLSPEKYDQLVGNGNGSFTNRITERERLMQEHADDIELYIDPCDYESLQEIGLPMEEIKEISKKLKQEQKDELLARRLQEMEQNDGLTQEERDRLLAIEAQDKELAKMLQEREKAKAKRAKEKARLRKNQCQKDSSVTTSNGNNIVLHCGPLQSLPKECLPSSTSAGMVLTEEDDPLDLEPYSNPIDMITNQRLYGGGSGGGTMSSGTSSLSRDISQHDSTGRRSNHHLNGNDSGGCGGKEDDIYTLPVDSCRPSNRPASLSITPETFINHHNSMTRSENYSSEGHDVISKLDVSPRMNHSKSGSFEKSSSPIPPYMPIQGTRRSNSSEERKKRTKDKCTHQ